MTGIDNIMRWGYIKKLLSTRKFRIIKSTRTSDGSHYYYIQERGPWTLWVWECLCFESGGIASSNTVEGCEKIIQDYVAITAPWNKELVAEITDSQKTAT